MRTIFGMIVMLGMVVKCLIQLVVKKESQSTIDREYFRTQMSNDKLYSDLTRLAVNRHERGGANFLCTVSFQTATSYADENNISFTIDFTELVIPYSGGYIVCLGLS